MKVLLSPEGKVSVCTLRSISFYYFHNCRHQDKSSGLQYPHKYRALGTSNSEVRAIFGLLHTPLITILSDRWVRREFVFLQDDLKPAVIERPAAKS